MVMDVLKSSYGLRERVGILRVAMGLLVLLTLPFVFYWGEDASGWRTISVYVVPVIALMLMWILPFDMLMSRVFMGEKHGSERACYKTVIVFDAILLAMLFLFWTPFFVKLLSG